jgi:hypothetical protein
MREPNYKKRFLRPSLVTPQAEEDASSTTGSSFASVIASSYSSSLATSSTASSGQVSLTKQRDHSASNPCLHKKKVLAGGTTHGSGSCVRRGDAR